MGDDKCMPAWTAVCANHKEPWEFFCKEHQECLCRSCLEEHKSHLYLLLEDAKAASMDILKENIRTLEDSQKQIQLNVVWLQDARSQVASDRAKLREQLAQLFDEVQETLALEKKAFLASVDDEKEKSLTLLESHLSEVQEKKGELARLITKANELVEKEISAKDFMDCYSWVMGKMLRIDINVPQCHAARHELDRTVIGQLKRDSQAAVRNVSKSIRDKLLRMPVRVTAPKPASSFTLKPPVPQRSVKSTTFKPSTSQTSDFLLDPNTAHCNISISEDRLSCQWVAHPLTCPPHPERFRLHPQVLCSQGLSAGEHTWQVEVGGTRRWEVGVTCKSRDQAWVDSCISWALRWDGRQLQAFEGHKRYFNSKLRTINRAPTLLRLHLHFSQKTELSFYTSEDDLLHTFTIKTSGPVFPGFYLEESSVKIKKLDFQKH
ncbi:E3 ubiquitin-protein ligase TRIM39-like [Astyanax mexicanus]|uniref:E3 ubiquitin-protein ligase TRIM39-like n=1 Tax=Astyanax mexicanus TaxID=7994 RepID=UPI000BBE00CC|nr:E3 ubiquitin-protein ligase TRIM39-like [Astyanax mexicanus]